MLSWLNTYSVPLHSELQRDTTTIMDFDQYEELLWIGSENGRVLSYLVSPDTFQPYTRFQASPTRVTGLLFDSQSILVLGSASLSAFTRGGCPIASNVLTQSALDRMTLGSSMDLHAFEFYSGGLAIGGMQRQLYLADLRTGQLSGVIDLPHDVGKIIKLPNNSLIIGGASTGEVTLIDGRTPKPIASVLAHPRGITSLATDSQSLVISTGLRDGVNPFGTSTLVPDVFCKCFDVRSLKSIAPVSVSSGANAVLVNRSKLGISPTVTVLSNFGMWQEGELCNDGHMKQPEFYRTECYPSESGVLTVNSWTLSSTCALLAQVDAADFIHMWHQVRVGGVINAYSQPTVLPSRSRLTGVSRPSEDVVASVGQVVSTVNAAYTEILRSGVVTGYQSLSSTQGLSGVFSKECLVRPPLPLVPEVKMNLRQGDEWTYAVNNNGKLVYNSLVSKARALTGLKVRREVKHGHGHGHGQGGHGRGGRGRAESAISDIMSPRGFGSEEEGEGVTSGAQLVVPRKRFRFRAVDHSMNHSLFPFASFNRTRFTGLENSGTSWDLFINAVFQLGFYLQPLRETCSAHVCSDEECLVCELGFLFHSMEQGVAVCQATRIVRCLKRDQRFVEIVEENKNHPAAIAGPFLKKLLEVVQDQMKDKVGLVSEAGRTVLDRLICHDNSLVVNVKTTEAVGFNDVVYEGLKASRGRLPPVLVVVPNSQQSAGCWRQTGYLPHTLFVEHERGPSGRVTKVATGSAPPKSTSHASTRFDLVAVTLHIADVDVKQAPQGHLVTMVEAAETLAAVSGSESDNEQGGSPSGGQGGHKRWLIFNDFVVSQSNLGEALDLSQVWKKPVVLMYVNKEGLKSVRPILSSGSTGAASRERSSLSSASSPASVVRSAPQVAGNPGAHEVGKSPIPLSMVLDERPVNKPQITEFKWLSDAELQQVLNGGLTLALDAEFVATGLGAVEIREDGSKETSRPQEMSLGRVTVLRENGDALMDHYLETDESEIKDWVTRFSGLKKGDLSKTTSLNYLSTSKQVYLKLRFLVDHGCRFIGHGLATDFRIIGLVVPKTNLIDTVELFHMPQQRFLSLKFLAARLLEREIQGDVHCSSEDALAALDLWRLHKRLKEEGRVELILQRLYDSGRLQGWK